jgi:hypothetical protein
MRIHLCIILAMALSVAGCSSNPLPPMERVDQIRLIVNQMPGESPVTAKPREVTLKERADIAEAMDWLNSIDWSQSGSDMRVIDIPRPDGAFTLIDKSAATQSYSFYWDGGFVHTKTQRFMRGGDTGKLKKLVERVFKQP